MGVYVTPKEKNRRRKEGLCIKCTKKGHSVSVCPSKEWVWEKEERKEKGRAAKIEESSSESESEN